MKYRAALDGVARDVEDLAQLRSLLDEIRRADRSTLTIHQVDGERKGFERWLYKLLGVASEIDGFSAILLNRGGLCALTFADEAGHELRVVGNDVRSAPDTTVAFDLGDGSLSMHSVEECMGRDEALRAIEDFYMTGKPPGWLAYREIR
jgi:hypothetical protein